jgi:hypothetical protein
MFGALKARCSTAQGSRARFACSSTLGMEPDQKKALKGRDRVIPSDRLRKVFQNLFRPCRAFILFFLTQGFGRCAAFTQGFAAPRFQRWFFVS